MRNSIIKPSTKPPKIMGFLPRRRGFNQVTKEIQALEACDAEKMYAYSQHEFLKRHKVAGLLLRPFCLGHADVLCGLDSPLYRGAAPEPVDLATALFVCSRTPEKARRQIRTGTAIKTLLRLGKRFGLMEPKQAGAVYEAFADYISTYSITPPRWEDGSENQQQSRAPWHLSIFCIIQEKTNLTAAQTWALPVARAFEIAAAIGSINGDDKLVSQAEMSIYKKMMADDEPGASALQE